MYVQLRNLAWYVRTHNMQIKKKTLNKYESRVVLTYNYKAQCKREVCKQYARKSRDTAVDDIA